MSGIVENARLELLRAYAWAHDRYPGEAFPLFVGEYRNTRDDITLALREAVALGQMERGGEHPNGPACRITPGGYAYIRSRDLAGELAQEATHER